MSTLSSRGAEWKLWDFHVHTPASYGWGSTKFHEMTTEEAEASLKLLVKTMNECPAEAFVFMDYWTFDGYLKLREYRRRNRTTF